jgi:hypothetical protein
MPNNTYVAAETLVRSYMGVNIYRLTHSGMYNALTGSGYVKADTLDGIKQLIREARLKDAGA